MQNISDFKRVELQRAIENKFSRKNITEVILKELDDSFEIKYRLLDVSNKIVSKLQRGLETAYESKAIRWDYLLNKCPLSVFDVVLEVFIKVIQHQNTSYQAVAGMVAPMLEFKESIDGVKTVADVMAFMAELDLIDAIFPSDSETGVLMVESKYELSDETKEFIEDTMYLPPMICSPVLVESNNDLDYLTQYSSMILGGILNQHNKKIGLDVINILNQQEWELDEYVLGFEETSKKPLDTHEKREQFEKMKRSSRKVYQLIMETGNKFYWTHKFDKRGRVYSQGYHVNIQSTDYKKALINLAKGEVVTK